MPLGKEVGLGPGHIALDGDPAPPFPRGRAPSFRPMSTVAKRSPISATAEHLFYFGVRSTATSVSVGVCLPAYIILKYVHVTCNRRSVLLS